MIKPSLKPDFDMSLQRFEAWWDGEILDRPPVVLGVQPSTSAKDVEPGESPEDLRNYWMNVEAVVDQQIASLLETTFLGDSIPAVMPNVGPDLTATLWGVELEFGRNTSWAVHTVNDVSEWTAFIDKTPDFSNVYWRTIEAMTARAHEQNGGRYIVRLPDLHGAYDMLVSLRGPDALCLDLMDEPVLVDKIAMNAADTYSQALKRSHDTILGIGYPSSSWLPYLHAGPAYIPSCDFWCLLSEDMAKSIVLKTIEREMEGLERSIFHLDGPQALRHLDLLLDMPELDGVQWVCGASNGPARNWIDVYRRIVSAGKCAEVICHDADDALAVLKELGPKGLAFSIGEAFSDAATAEKFLERVTRLSN